MKAALYDRYGSADVIKVQEINKPVVKKKEVLIKVVACSINPRDAGIRRGDLKILSGSAFPKLTGADFSGVILELGEGVLDFKVGDCVNGYIQSVGHGCSAEYVSVPYKWLSKKPKDLPHTIAAAIPCTYLTSLQALRNKGQIKYSDRVLIYGASGGVGTAAIQLAKFFKAHVTAVCSAKNKSYCIEQGADEVWCYDKEDIFKRSERFNIFFQVYSNNGLLYNEAHHLLETSGTYLTLIPSPTVFLQGLLNKLSGKPLLKSILVRVVPKDLAYINTLVQQEKISPNINYFFTLEEIKKAHELIETEHTVGKIIVTLNEQ